MESILIAGAGPVRIIDRAHEPTQTCKALVIWSRTLELIERMGCVQGLLDAGLKAHQASLQDGHKVLGQTSLDHVASPYNFALMIPQRDTERLLNAHLESLGAVSWVGPTIGTAPRRILDNSKQRSEAGRDHRSDS